MELIKWANGEGQTIKLDKDEAAELRYLIDKALQVGKAESGFIDPTTEIEIS